jgi:hypothetical protein
MLRRLLGQFVDQLHRAAAAAGSCHVVSTAVNWALSSCFQSSQAEQLDGSLLGSMSSDRHKPYPKPDVKLTYPYRVAQSKGALFDVDPLLHKGFGFGRTMKKSGKASSQQRGRLDVTNHLSLTFEEQGLSQRRICRQL